MKRTYRVELSPAELKEAVEQWLSSQADGEHLAGLLGAPGSAVYVDKDTQAVVWYYQDPEES